MPNVALRMGCRIVEGNDKTIPTKFGNFVRSIRTNRGMSQKEVAYKLGIKSESTISKWEQGIAMPSVKEVLYGMIDIFTLDNYELAKLYDLGDDMMKNTLRDDKRIQKMLELRKQGLTNKQIANDLGCAVSTVYENIGKRSISVQKAEEQNKPCPIPEKVDHIPEAEETKQEEKTMPSIIPAKPPITSPKANTIGVLSIRKEVRILELNGTICNYKVNTGSGEIELISFPDRASLVEGILDRRALDSMISELQSIRTLL